MNSNSELQLLYLKYKKSLLPLIFISLSFFMLFRIVLPQISSISESNQAISDKTLEVATLEKSLSTIETQNVTTINDNFELTNRALPTSKDVAIIFTALASAASDAQVDLKEFSIKVGGVFGKTGGTSSTSNFGTPKVDVETRISSIDGENTYQFVKKVQEKLPLSEIKNIDSTGALATVVLSFFYKPADLTLLLKQDNVKELTKSDVALLEQLKSWDQ